MEIVIYRKGVPHAVLYDDADHELVSKHCWHVSAEGYVVTKVQLTRGERKGLSMHRLILGLTDASIHTDHKNHNRLDNRRCNIRACTMSENRRNHGPSGLSKYLGVSFANHNIKGVPYRYIVARIKVNKKPIHLGVFKTEEDAAMAYDVAALKHFGEFAYLNFPDEHQHANRATHF